MATENDPLLEKAHSVGVHLARMDKAVEDFHTKLSKLHKIHSDDMKASITKLNKMVGTAERKDDSYGDMEPKDTDLESAGTKNIQDFGKGAPAVEKTTPAAAAPAALSKEDIEALVAKAVESSMVTVLKALTARPDDDDDEDDDDEPPMPPPKRQRKAVAEPGIGDRRQLQEPVRTPVIAVNKVEDGNQLNTPQPTLTPELAKRAMEGDQAAILALMKTKPTEVPVTLIEPLSKIH